MQLKTNPKSHISFDPETHTFTSRDGAIVPGVTQKLAEKGYVSKFYKGTAARDNGTEIHALTEIVDRNPRIIPRGSNEFVAESIYAYAKFIQSTRLKRVAFEEIVYSPVYNYAGIKDGDWLFDGELWTGDIKTGSTIPSWAKLQLAAYDIADGATIIRPPRKRFCIHVRPEGCKIKTYTSYEDYKEWIGLFRS